MGREGSCWPWRGGGMRRTRSRTPARSGDPFTEPMEIERNDDQRRTMVSPTVMMARSGSAMLMLMMALLCGACGDRDQEFATVRNPAPAVSKPMVGGDVADSLATARMVTDGAASDTAASTGAARQDAASLDIDL